MDNPNIEAQARDDDAEDRRRKQAILEELYCPTCGIEVGPDYEEALEDCACCGHECCQHMGRWVESDWAALEIFLCYECDEA